MFCLQMFEGLQPAKGRASLSRFNLGGPHAVSEHGYHAAVGVLPSDGHRQGGRLRALEEQPWVTRLKQVTGDWSTK